VSLLVDDRALLKRFKAGERDTLARVFSHYAPTVALLLARGFSFRAGGERVRFSGYGRRFELEDVLHDVFRKAFGEKARDSYDGLRPYAAYLATIARNLVIDDYSQRKRELSLFTREEVSAEEEWTSHDDPFANDAPAPSGRPERDMMNAELRALVQQFKAQLDARELRIFELRFDESLSHTEIGERTSLTASQIKTTESKLRSRLVRHLKANGYFEHVRAGRHASLVIEGDTP
jgi:RNA polymerase sigma factor (sigma-70 family)